VDKCGTVINWYYFLAAIICSVILITTARVRHFQHASDYMLSIFSVHGSVCLNPMLFQEDTLFVQGDMAVYPAHGVGVIEAIESQTVAGIDQAFYVMKILDNNMKIMIPTATSDNVGLRAIISKKEVEAVLDILKDRETEIGAQTWNRRYRDYMEKIKTGSIHEVAAVLRDLYLLSVDKDLSYGERKMMDTAKNLLVTEISLARKVDETKTEKMIEKMFN
jgi:CarD family transcriptional regulator